MRNYVTGKYQLHVRLTGRRKSSQNFWLNFEKKKKIETGVLSSPKTLVKRKN